MFGLSFVSCQTGGVSHIRAAMTSEHFFCDSLKVWSKNWTLAFYHEISHLSHTYYFPLRRWHPYCHQFAQLVKDQEKFITQPLFCLLLTHSGETKLRQQASGETITGPLLFLHWGHPSAQCSRNKGQGFIAGSTVWKETHSNIVWFSEIVAGIPAVSYHIIAIKQVCLHLSSKIEICFLGCVHIFCWNFLQTISCPRVPQSRRRAWHSARVGMSSLFSLTRWQASDTAGKNSGVGEGQSHTRVGVVWAFLYFFTQIKQGLSSRVSFL